MAWTSDSAPIVESTNNPLSRPGGSHQIPPSPTSTARLSTAMGGLSGNLAVVRHLPTAVASQPPPPLRKACHECLVRNEHHRHRQNPNPSPGIRPGSTRSSCGSRQDAYLPHFSHRKISAWGPANSRHPFSPFFQTRTFLLSHNKNFCPANRQTLQLPLSSSTRSPPTSIFLHPLSPWAAAST